MKKLNVTFEGITDTTGYLFSLTKCLQAALRCGGYEAYAEDIVAASGFAFRLWAAADLCPSATSIWEFKKQKPWVENGGLTCAYVERLWGEDAVAEERRLEALRLIRESIDRGTAAVAWDLSGAEWGLVTGYDDETKTLFTRKISGEEDSISYESLGRLTIPILSVLTVTGTTPRTTEEIVVGAKTLAASHLRGEERCDNTQGLAAYDTILSFVQEQLSADTAWNLEYYLGTYAALRWYAWKFFEKQNESTLAERYETVHRAWQTAFTVWRSRKNAHDSGVDETARAQVAKLLLQAREAEAEVLLILTK